MKQLPVEIYAMLIVGGATILYLSGMRLLTGLFPDRKKQAVVKMLFSLLYLLTAFLLRYIL